MTGASQGLGMLSKIGGAVRRSPESRACIDAKKRQGKSGRQARRECKDIYGSRLGNAGRKLGIFPQEAKGLSISQFAQKQFRKGTPSPMGMVNEQLIAGGGATQPTRAGFNPIWILGGALLLLPFIRKQFKF